MSETKGTMWDELRKPFPKESVGKLPKGGVMLDYVGHAAVCDRLNSVDPTWTWEPMALDEFGLPKFTQGEPQFGKPTKGLWIRLTIGGVTRPGYGDGKNEKEAIGDALRNAAMRFGVALELWSKDELESNVEHKDAPVPVADPDLPARDVRADITPISTASKTKLRQAFVTAGITGEAATSFIREHVGKNAPETEEDAAVLLAAIAVAEGMGE